MTVIQAQHSKLLWPELHQLWAEKIKSDWERWERADKRIRKSSAIEKIKSQPYF